MSEFLTRLDKGGYLNPIMLFVVNPDLSWVSIVAGLEREEASLLPWGAPGHQPFVGLKVTEPAMLQDSGPLGPSSDQERMLGFGLGPGIAFLGKCYPDTIRMPGSRTSSSTQHVH